MQLRQNITVLQRFDPFQCTVSLRAAMDQLTDQNMQRAFGDEDAHILPAPDISESDDSYAATASLPGIKPEDIDITSHNNWVTIRGEAQKNVTVPKIDGDKPEKMSINDLEPFLHR